MGTFDNPFDADRRLRNGGCPCGGHANRSEHDRASPDWPECSAIDGEEAGYETVVAAAAMRAIFPKDAVRRAFLKSVGASTALAALAQFFPLATATEVFAQGAGAPEKKDLKVGFIPITCATPIIMAHPMGFYSKQGLNVEVVKTAGWAVVRDKTVNKEYDASHMLSPMPLALSLGLGSQPVPFAVPAIENINGQGITLAIKHKDKRDPKQWKGFKFAIPFDYSMHNYLLRYYLAEHGIDPEADVQLRVVPPPEMVANLRADNIDGFLAPDNICQRAIYDGVGFLHILSKEIWDGHPCCSFTASKEFITQMPNSYAALVRAIVDATAFASKALGGMGVGKRASNDGPFRAPPLPRGRQGSSREARPPAPKYRASDVLRRFAAPPIGVLATRAAAVTGAAGGRRELAAATVAGDRAHALLAPPSAQLAPVTRLRTVEDATPARHRRASGMAHPASASHAPRDDVHLDAREGLAAARAGGGAVWVAVGVSGHCFRASLSVPA